MPPEILESIMRVVQWTLQLRQKQDLETRAANELMRVKEDVRLLWQQAAIASLAKGRSATDAARVADELQTMYIDRFMHDETTTH
jgi:hypothetical protein